LDMNTSKPHKLWFFGIGFLAILCCILSIVWAVKPEVVDANSFSNLVMDGDALWFGAGYNLYRVDLIKQTAILVYDTKDVRISFVQIDGNRLFFGGSSEKQNVIWALDLDGEKILWTQEFGRSRGLFIKTGGFSVQPLIANEVLLIGEVDRFYALDKNSGNIEWEIEDNWFEFKPIIMNDQLVYSAYKFGEKDPQANHTISFADPLSGQTIRTISMPGYLGGMPAIHGNCLFVKEDLDPDPKSIEMSGAHRIVLNCVDSSSGKTLWSVEGEDYLRDSQIGFHNGMVFDVFYNQVFAIDEQSGSLLWKSYGLDDEYYLYENPQVIEELNWIALEAYGGPAKVIFLELADGRLRNEELVDNLCTPIFISQDAIYGIENALIRVDLVTGKIVWSIPVDSHYFLRRYGDND